MTFATTFSCILLFQLGRYSSARPETATTCLTQNQCDERRQQLGLVQLSSGPYRTKGCYSRGDKAYFGTGGTEDDKSKSPKGVKKIRIWCNESLDLDSSVISASPPAITSQSQTACLTQMECNIRRKEQGFGNYFIGEYQTKGCFSKDGYAYFGMGGTEDENSSELSFLGEQKENRIWCGSSSNSQMSAISTGVITGDYCIGIQVITDEFCDQTGFKLSTKPQDGSTSKALLDYPIGSLEKDDTYAKKMCVSEGTYTLTIVGKASYSASVNEEEVLFGGNLWGKTSSYEIIAGYKPSLNSRENEWLHEHNTRREAFHNEHGIEYRPLQWSHELAKDASEWLENMLPSCESTPAPDLEEGENVASAKRSGPSDTELPSNILTRWSDRKLDKDYPNNQTLTQVMWRATRHVGCSDKYIINADGTYCYASICRYSRPGNCNMHKQDWLDATLADHSACGQVCPEEGCH